MSKKTELIDNLTMLYGLALLSYRLQIDLDEARGNEEFAPRLESYITAAKQFCRLYIEVTGKVPALDLDSAMDDLRVADLEELDG